MTQKQYDKIRKRFKHILESKGYFTCLEPSYFPVRKGSPNYYTMGFLIYNPETDGIFLIWECCDSGHVEHWLKNDCRQESHRDYFLKELPGKSSGRKSRY